MKTVKNYLTMWAAWLFFWVSTALMLACLVLVCTVVPAALVVGIWQLIKWI